jgi:hypothetical protein
MAKYAGKVVGSTIYRPIPSCYQPHQETVMRVFVGLVLTTNSGQRRFYAQQLDFGTDDAATDAVRSLMAIHQSIAAEHIREMLHRHNNGGLPSWYQMEGDVPELPVVGARWAYVEDKGWTGKMHQNLISD